MLTLYSRNVIAKYALVFAYDTNPEVMSSIEYLCDSGIPYFDIYLTKEERKDIQVVMPSDGAFDIRYKGKNLVLTVESVFTPNSEILLDRETSDIIKRITLQVKDDPQSIAHVLAFVEDAKVYVEEKLGNVRDQRTHSITKYVYEPKYEEWNVLNVCNMRSMDTIFMDLPSKQKLLAVVEDFTHPDTLKDYQHFNIPYKLNILLYGKHGTGKTSTIHAIASHFRADMFILNFSRKIDDAALAKAFNTSTLSSYKRNSRKQKIIVLEDIDCIFTNRKEHDTAKNEVTLSGLLNVLDGLMRAEGTIAFLTANNIDVIDKALLRPCRMDLIMEYTDASKDQLKQMFAYYFSSQADRFEAFYRAIEFKHYTTSMLQQFFFRHRRATNILDHISDLQDMVQFGDSVHSNTHANNIYM